MLKTKFYGKKHRTLVQETLGKFLISLSECPWQSVASASDLEIPWLPSSRVTRDNRN